MSNGERTNSTQNDIAVSATRGVFWTGGGQLIRQVLGILASIVLARLLIPEDFGLMGMAIVFVSFSQLLADFGIGSAIVQAQKLTSVALSSCFWSNLAVALTMAVVLSFAAPWIAGFYGDERVSSLIQALSITLIFAGLTTVPRSLLFKAMNFAEAAKAQVIGSAAGAVTAILMALFGFGVWSLVVQPVVGGLFALVFTWRASAWFPKLCFSWSSIKEMVNFSAGVLGASILNQVNRNADDLLIGRFLGTGPLGYYSLAYQLMLYPMTQVTSVIVRVLFPALSQLQDEPERYARAYLRSISAIAMITFPIMLGLFSVSEEFVLIVFGGKWLPMVGVLKIFCVVGLVQSISSTIGTIYLSTGNTKKLFQITLLRTPIILVAFYIGLTWGIEGVAAAYGIVSLCFFYFILLSALRLIQMEIAGIYRALIPKLASGLLMLAGNSAIAHFLLNSYAPGTRLVILVASGACIYIPVLWLLDQRELTETFQLARNALRKRAAPAEL